MLRILPCKTLHCGSCFRWNDWIPVKREHKQSFINTWTSQDWSVAVSFSLNMAPRVGFNLKTMIQCWLGTAERSTLCTPPFDLRQIKSIWFHYAIESLLSQSIWFITLNPNPLTDLWSIINLGYSFCSFFSLHLPGKTTRCSWSGIQTKAEVRNYL